MKSAIIFLLSALAVGCTNAPQPIANANTNRPLRSEQMQNTTAHTTENQTPRPANSNSTGGKWSQSGDPVDTTEYDSAIAAAEKELKSKPSDDAANKALAEALFDRGFALTQARQYAAALGDYRRALKHDPNHAESKKWIEQIVGIYQMLKKEPPKEGEEPPPLPLTKAA